MEDKYVVTYKHEDGTLNCKVMTGQELANMYGFSDCTGEKVLYVYRVLEGGNLWTCGFHTSWDAPFNRLTIHRGIGDIVTYEWEEH